jgi:class 3 adenylate cyclase/tetratricopeptide (TPR) repeat protein
MPPAAKFCPECAHPAGIAPATPASYTPRHLADRILNSRGALEGERKHVTVLFADLKGSLELIADRDPDEARKILDPVLERMMEAVHHYEGTVNEVRGDGIMALFGAPLAHEDHAVRGCYAALRMQQAVRRYTEEVRRAYGVEVQIRVGLNSGEVVVRAIGGDLRMDYAAVGQTTHLAARMEQLATPGTTRLTADTLALAEGYIEVKPIGPIPVKGLAQPVEAYELTGAGAARTRLQAARARGLTRFVGRDTELDQIRRAAEETRGGRGQIVAVVGEPGVGKSRLYYEFIHSHRVQDWLVLEAGSVSYGKATPYLPLADLLRGYFKIDARDDIRGIRVKVTGGLLTLDEALKDTVPVALWLLDALPDDSAFVKLDPAERRRQTLAAIKRILLRENQLHPVLLLFEDLHWIDNETQAFLDSLVESLPASRILLAVNYRPEYRHGWANKTYYRQLRIDPLPPESAEDLLDALLGQDPSTSSLKRLLIERTEGSPLFLEESVRTLVETRALVGERGAYRLVHAPDTLQVPATVQAIIAARIDRLDPEEKRVLQAAAVIGTHVPFALLRAIVDVEEEVLRRCLAQLQTAEFLYEAQLFPDLEYQFKHALTHEVAYGSVLQDRRRALHAAIVEAIERLHGARLPEHVEMLAHHAFRGGLPVKAVKYLRQAGAKAVARSASREAVAFFEQALGLLGEMPETEQAVSEALDIRIALGPALIGIKGGSSVEVEASYTHARDLVDRLGDASRRFAVLWGLWYVKFTRGEYAEAVDAGEQLLAAAKNGDDTGQLLEAHHTMWPTLFGMGEHKAALAHMERGIALYDRDQHSSQTYVYGGHDPGACCRWHLAYTHWVLGFPDRALNAAHDALRLAEDLRHGMTAGIAHFCAAWIHYQRGEAEAAARYAEHVISMAGSYGLASHLEGAMVVCHSISDRRLDTKVLGDLHRRVKSSALSAGRLGFPLCVLAALYAEAGDIAQARSVLAAIGENVRGNFYAPEILRIEGELMLKSTESDASRAERCFRGAIVIARGRDAKSFELRAATNLARLLDSQGRREEAYATLAPVYGWFTEGFDTADLKSASALLDSFRAGGG